MTVTPVSKVDPGELLLEVARNAEHIAPEMQRAMAGFIELWGTPQITVQPLKVDL